MNDDIMKDETCNSSFMLPTIEIYKKKLRGDRAVVRLVIKCFDYV